MRAVLNACSVNESFGGDLYIQQSQYSLYLLFETRVIAVLEFTGCSTRGNMCLFGT
jgi:hypothetical protein